MKVNKVLLDASLGSCVLMVQALFLCQSKVEKREEDLEF